MEASTANQAALKTFFAGEPAVIFAYLFGSAATGETGPLSDLDLAVYLDRRRDPFNCRLQLMEGVAKALGDDNFDLIVLNRAPVLLSYQVIADGVILKENRRQRVPFEAKVLSRYLDTAHLRQVQQRYLKEQLERGDYFG